MSVSRSIVGRLALAGAALVLPLFLLELAVRGIMSFDRNSLDETFNRPLPVDGRKLALADLIRPNPNDRIVYELRPGMRGKFLGHDLSINSLGMRDVERSREKAPGTFRIVGFGDSHMFGWGVDRDEAFLAILERLLNERFPERRFEVLNLAVPGYNAVQEVEVFTQRAEELDPDLAIINYVDNDMDLPNFLAKRPNLWTLRKSYLAELARRRLALLRGATILPIDIFGVTPEEGTLRYRFDPARIPERFRPLAGWNNMVGAYEQLAHLARKRGIPFVLLFNWDDYSLRLAGRTADIRPREVRQLADLCARAGYRIVDPQDRIFRVLTENHLDSRALWISSSDSHTNPLRHRLVADELLEALTQADALTPRKSSP